MTRNPFAWLLCGVLALAAASGLSTRPAQACTLTGGGFSGAALSPIDGKRAGVGGAFLLKGAREPWLESPTGEPSNLIEVRRFHRLQEALAPSLVLFEPSVALLPEQHYTLHISDSAAVQFLALAETPRRSAELVLNVALEEVPQNRLDSAGCYGGPLNDRPFTQVAKVSLAYTQPTPLVLSVIAHDDSSGQDIEDSTFDGDLLPESGAGLSLLFPLPDGVAHCFHVAVLDFAGTVLFDAPELCAQPDGTSSTFTAHVVDLEQPGAEQPVPSDELPQSAPNADADADPSAAGCALAVPHRLPAPLVAAAFAVLGSLLVRRRLGSRVT